ncbi:MFS transporter [Sphingomonas sp. 1P06PA]|uniref:MFS transporter n=1 Tax=Sphingomonas sp. 1P06PA TaxID=554121 RepID=UPI0039A5C560
MAMSAGRPPGSIGWRGAILFASGDFAFNLYWQAVSLYLLFFYTDALGLPAASAGLIFLIGSVWDGIVDFGIGMAADHSRIGRRGFAPLLVAGAIPLGVSAFLLFTPIGTVGAAAVLAVHLLFRTLYGALNILYAAMTVRVTGDGGDRARIGGLRMMFGTLAAVAVALTTQPLVGLGGGGPAGWMVPAGLSAVVATLLLLLVAARCRETIPPEATVARNWRETAATLMRSRSYAWLLAATVGMTLAAAMFTKSILYHFKYRLGDAEAAGPALAAMGIAGALTAPLWMAIASRQGADRLWHLGVAIAIASMLGSWAIGLHGGAGGLAILMITQAALVALNIGFWTLLPDSIDRTARTTGVRSDATAVGLAALVQKLALGIGAALFGLLYDAAGYVANIAQPPVVLARMDAIMLLVPPVALVASSIAVALGQRQVDRG